MMTIDCTIRLALPFGAAALPPSAPQTAASTRNVWNGVYTGDQAQRGLTVGRCAAICHLDDLQALWHSSTRSRRRPVIRVACRSIGSREHRAVIEAINASRVQDARRAHSSRILEAPPRR